MTTRTPLTGPVVWRGDEIKNSKRWIRDLPASAIAELDAALSRRQGQGPRLVADHARGLSAVVARRPAGRHRRRARERRRHHESCAASRWTRYDEDDLRRIYFGLGTHLGTPVFQNRSGELMRAIRDEGAHVGRTYGETKDQKGTTFLSSYARTPDQRRPALPHRPHRRGRPACACARRAPAASARLPATPAIHNAILAQAARPARRAVQRLLAQPLRRGRHRPRRPPIRCRSSACATASSPRTIRSPSSRPPRWRPASRSSPTRRRKRSTS